MQNPDQGAQACAEIYIEPRLRSFLPLIQAAVTEVFDSMIMVPVSCQEPTSQCFKDFVDSVSSIIGVSGNIKGLLAVHCPKDVAANITSLLLGCDEEVMDEELIDTVGELANMIGGGLKSRLLESGTSVDLSIPSTCSGDRYHIDISSQVDGMHVPFQLEGKSFWVELSLAEIES